MKTSPRQTLVSALCALGMLSACGGDDSGAQADARIEASFQVSGTVAGLTGDLTLELNGMETVDVSVDGAFSFAAALKDADAYLVTVLSQPDGQDCVVANGSGALAGADVSDVQVTCANISLELTGLSLSLVSPLGPAFDPTQLSYQVDVSVLESEVIVTPTALDPNVTILVEGTEVTSGTASAAIPLDLGSNTITVTVEAGGQSLSYLLEIDRGAEVIEQIAYGKASNAEAGDQFGLSVSLSGDTLAVGAFAEDSNATGVDGDQSNNSVSNSGAVYVFRRTGSTWAQEAYLKASTTGFDDEFGISVSLSGDTLAVGARFEDSNATGIDGDQNNNSAGNSGAVYVFRRTGSTWTQEAYIKASNPGANDRFGVSVSLSGSALAVGASLEASNATGIDGDQNNNSAGSSGAVYVFRRTGSTWAQEAYLKASNTETFDRFGISVSLSGSALAVGAQGESSNATGVDGDEADNTANRSGAVYVFRRTGSTWAQEAYVKASNTEASDAFGISVSLLGDTLAAGAYLENSNATGVDGDQADNSAFESGAVYVFRRTGGTWAQEAYVKASNTGGNDLFGYSVSLSGNALAVGAYNEASNATGIDGDQSNNSANGSGAAYVFRRAGSTWTQDAYVKASNTDGTDRLGISVSLSDNALAAGAFVESSNATGVDGDQSDNSAVESGAVYLFQ